MAPNPTDSIAVAGKDDRSEQIKEAQFEGYTKVTNPGCYYFTYSE
jgi:hypothetical protein